MDKIQIKMAHYSDHERVNNWFYSLDLEQLAKMFYWPDNYDANEFIERCDDVWADMTYEQKQVYYTNYPIY